MQRKVCAVEARIGSYEANQGARLPFLLHSSPSDWQVEVATSSDIEGGAQVVQTRKLPGEIELPFVLAFSDGKPILWNKGLDEQRNGETQSKDEKSDENQAEGDGTPEKEHDKLSSGAPEEAFTTEKLEGMLDAMGNYGVKS